MKRINIILDTDIGDDIDDAFALACLLNMQDKVNIVGITTVFVNSDHRARMVKKLLHLHHDDNIPVYAGIREGDGSIDINGECCQFTEDLLNDESLIIIETDQETEILKKINGLNIKIVDKRKYGRAHLIFLKKEVG